MKRLHLILIFLIGISCPCLATGDVVQIDASMDSAIIDQLPDNGMGANTWVAVGSTNSGQARRGLFFMDIASFIPSGATINSVAFEFDVTQQGGGMGQQGAEFALFGVTSAWTEGTGFGTGGSATGDGATWSTTNGVDAWTTSGGDFDATSAGSVFVDWAGDGSGLQTYSLGNAQLIAIVQNMLNNPGSNFGFELMALNESLGGSAMRLTSRENSSTSNGSGARLIIDFSTSAVPEPGSAIFLLGVGLFGLHRRTRRQV